MSDSRSASDPKHSAADSLRIELEWGEQGILAAPMADVYVIIDVLSFSTCVDIALSRGGFILPYRFRDASAAAFAASRQALLARDREQPGFTLSPGSLTSLPAGTRLVLPSPNGATLSRLPETLTDQAPPLVLCACLRNAAAVAAWIAAQARNWQQIRVIPAGERWPDGSLRPAIEDWLGAGSVLAGLPDQVVQLGPEATLARDNFLQHRHRLGELIRACPSGQELIGRGFGADVELALARDASRTVPGLAAEAYADLAARSTVEVNC